MTLGKVITTICTMKSDCEDYNTSSDLHNPHKRVKLLSDDDSDDASSSFASGGSSLNLEPGISAGRIRINKEYAIRFEHNQRRIELERRKSLLIAHNHMLTLQ